MATVPACIRSSISEDWPLVSRLAHAHDLAPDPIEDAGFFGLERATVKVTRQGRASQQTKIMSRIMIMSMRDRATSTPRNRHPQ